MSGGMESMSEDDKEVTGYQIGGSHYAKYPIQPAEFIHKNNIPYLEGNVIKYVLRHRDKNGRQDLEKALHYINMIIEFEYK